MKICFPNWNSCTVLREVNRNKRTPNSIVFIIDGTADTISSPSLQIQSLRRLSHPHIVQLKEVLREEDNSLNLVFEYLEANLYDVMRHQTS
mmetsp:Transcript_37478/g.87402  ORF Transcript_37478/g.87402 Transcript_37478/m.87402 type:complete len:91 (-) Transcript_37478:177-449(-)